MALGDMHFDRKQYDRALHFYLPLYSNFPPFLSGYRDSLWFRAAYSYCSKEQWDESIPFLNRFHDKFPDSPLARQAADLYYAAATRIYEETGTEKNRQLSIDAIRKYIKQYRGKNPELSEARFKLGKHYQKTGEPRKAVLEFSRVTKGSPNYHAARYHVLQYYVNELKDLERRGLHRSKDAVDLYDEGVRHLNDYKRVVAKHKDAAPQKKTKAHMVVLESQLLIFGPNKGCHDILKNLENFEMMFPRQEKLHLETFRLRLACYHRLHMPEDIQEEIDRFTAFKPLNGNRYALLYSMGDTYFQGTAKPGNAEPESDSLRNWDTALLIYGKLREISRNHSDYTSYFESAQLRMARIYIQKDQLDQAEALCRDVLEKNSLSADAVYNIGLLHEKKGQWAEALDVWRRFSNGVEADTYHWFESRYRTAWAFAKLGNNKKACDILTITLVLHPDLGNDELKESFLNLKSKICK
jgi:tetratricopeptide (TPR) repeat protein